jgi:hypothetical protein
VQQLHCRGTLSAVSLHRERHERVRSSAPYEATFSASLCTAAASGVPVATVSVATPWGWMTDTSVTVTAFLSTKRMSLPPHPGAPPAAWLGSRRKQCALPPITSICASAFLLQDTHF